jgi:hypothetical protein
MRSIHPSIKKTYNGTVAALEDGLGHDVDDGGEDE